MENSCLISSLTMAFEFALFSAFIFTSSFDLYIYFKFYPPLPYFAALDASLTTNIKLLARNEAAS